MDKNEEKIARLKEQLTLLAQDLPGNKFERPLQEYQRVLQELHKLKNDAAFQSLK